MLSDEEVISLALGESSIILNGAGSKLATGTNYRDVKLHAHDEIALIYGTPPANIPSRYDFPQGL